MEQIKKLTEKLLENGYRDGEHCLLKQWSPRKGHHFVQGTLLFNHPILGIYPHIRTTVSNYHLLWNIETTIKKRNGKNILIL